MDERLQREQALFEAALQLPQAERGPFLDRECGQDAALRQRIEGLIKSHEESSGVLDQSSVVEGQAGPARFPAAEKPGDRIGRYKLLEKIGEGGCGIVYMAEQEEPVRRRVALKLIKLGMDTRQFVARFEAERQALALMDHPNIAKVHDAGATDTGRPFIVMELVRGVKITDYCDEKRLSTRERLELFVQVCQAVQHAHQKGIIHRDLKPSNVLVTLNDGAAVAKVIDFGIAKVTTGERLTDKTIFTAFEQFIGTPAYMSPEQAELTSVDIDTRSDIYSLGVLLYELLTGQTPFDAKELLRAGLDEMRRTIRESEPARPSTRLSTLGLAELKTTAHRRGLDAPKLVSSLRGDLDWVVMKCLEKDRKRRYETTNGLASDIRRHLNNETVSARPPNKLYRFQKVVRRNRLAFAAGAIVAASLVIGLGVSAWLLKAERAARFAEEAQRRKAEANHREAEAEAAKRLVIIHLLEDLLSGVRPEVAQGLDTKLMRKLLDDESIRIDQSLTNQPAVEMEIRNLLGGVYFEIGEYQKAEAMHRRALAICQGLPGNHDHELARSYYGLANALQEARSLSEAETNALQAVALARRLPSNEHLLSCLNTLATVLRGEGKISAAIELFREVLKIRESAPATSSRDLVTSLNNLGLALRDQTKYGEAEELYLRALRIATNSFPADDPMTATVLNSLSAVALDQRRLAEAEELIHRVVEMTRRLHNEDHPTFAVWLNTLAQIRLDMGNYAEAEETFQEVLAKMKVKFPPRHQNIATVLNNIATARGRRGNISGAVDLYRQVLEMQLEVLGQNHPSVALTRENLGKALRSLDQLPESESFLGEALGTYRTQYGDESATVTSLHADLVDVLVRERKTKEALALCDKMLPPDLESHPKLSRYLLTRAGVQARGGHWREAAVDATRAVSISKDHDALAGQTLILLLLADGKRESAGEACEQTLARFTATNDPVACVRMATDCLLIPPSGVKVEEAARLAESAVMAWPTNTFCQLCEALAEYRQGQFAGAANHANIVLLNKTEPSGNRFYLKAQLLLALAQWRLMQPDAARAALANAKQMAKTDMATLDSGDLGRGWPDWIISRSLIDEATALIGDAMPSAPVK